MTLVSAPEFVGRCLLSLTQALAKIAMRKKYVAAFVLLFLGSNLITYGLTRYWTTQYVLLRAQQRMDAALHAEGVYERLYPNGRARNISTQLAIRYAGGMYYWWNEALPYWGGGMVLVICGLLVSRYNPKQVLYG